MSDPEITPETNPTPDERPDWLPEKFSDPQAMATAYAELEKKQSQTAPAGITKDPEKEADTAGTNLDLSTFYTEYADNDKLSDESYSKLEASGWSKTDVDRFISLETAERGREAAALYETIEGGAETYNQAVAWAKVEGNVDVAYSTEFDQVMHGDNTKARSLFMNDLVSKWQGAGGVVVSAQGTNVENIPSHGGPQKDVFTDNLAIIHAQRDLKYKNDPVHRAAVEAKILRSLK